MDIGLGVKVGCMFFLCVVLEAFASLHVNKNFFPSQVWKRTGKAGISFLTHLGMWSDMFVLPILFGTIVAVYGPTWDIDSIDRMIVVGVCITALNQILCNQSPVPDPLGWKEEKFSLLMALHFVYMSYAVAFAGLFFFSDNVPQWAAVTVAAILGVHMGFGTHVPMGLIQRWMQWYWCPDFLGSPVLPYLSAGIWAAMIALATIAAGWKAGVWVGIIALFLTAWVLFAIMLLPAPYKRYGE